MSAELPKKKARDAKPSGDGVEPTSASASQLASPPEQKVKALGGPAILHKVHLDPATGFGIFVPGLFVMALGGALTWHWIFNIGSGIMMAGMTYVVAAIMLTALQQRFEKKRGTTSTASAS